MWDTNKLAQDIEGWMGPSMLFSEPSPTQVIGHAFCCSGQAQVPSAVLFRHSAQAFSESKGQAILLPALAQQKCLRALFVLLLGIQQPQMIDLCIADVQ